VTALHCRVYTSELTWWNNSTQVTESESDLKL
jgi:hypothetical protein